MDQTTQAPQRILIVERDHSIRELLDTFLGQEGYQTALAASLEEALDKMDEQLFDLVVMDPFAQPNQPRLAAAERFQQRCAPTPVGILTGWQILPEEREQADFAFLLPKPFNLEDLLQCIANRLNQPFTPEQQQQVHVIRRAAEAVSGGDWETLRSLCMPTVCYYPLTGSLLMPKRAFIGIEDFLIYAQLVRQQLPSLQVEQVVIFQHPKGLMARFNLSVQGRDGQRYALAGTVICRFRGERISQMAVSLPVQRFQALLAQAALPGAATKANPEASSSL